MMLSVDSHNFTYLTSIFDYDKDTNLKGKEKFRQNDFDD